MRFLPALFLLAALALPGCADMNISNPFESTRDVNEVYFDQFPDVPIPSDMSIDRSRSLVSVGPDGTKVGLLTAEGRVERLSLSNALIQNMSKQGWSLRGLVAGNKTLQLYEKDNRYAVIYIYDQLASAGMEIWLATRLNEGAISFGNTGGVAGGSGQPSFNLAPGQGSQPASGSGGVQQQGLTQ